MSSIAPVSESTSKARAHNARTKESLARLEAALSRCCPTSVHEALKHSPQWETLQLVGYVGADGFRCDDPAKAVAALRNCSCGSTLMRKVVA